MTAISRFSEVVPTFAEEASTLPAALSTVTSRFAASPDRDRLAVPSASAVKAKRSPSSTAPESRAKPHGPGYRDGTAIGKRCSSGIAVRRIADVHAVDDVVRAGDVTGREIEAQGVVRRRTAEGQYLQRVGFTADERDKEGFVARPTQRRTGLHGPASVAQEQVQIRRQAAHGQRGKTAGGRHELIEIRGIIEETAGTTGGRVAVAVEAHAAGTGLAVAGIADVHAVDVIRRTILPDTESQAVVTHRGSGALGGNVIGTTGIGNVDQPGGEIAAAIVVAFQQHTDTGEKLQEGVAEGVVAAALKTEDIAFAGLQGDREPVPIADKVDSAAGTATDRQNFLGAEVAGNRIVVRRRVVFEGGDIIAGIEGTESAHIDKICAVDRGTEIEQRRQAGTTIVIDCNQRAVSAVDLKYRVSSAALLPSSPATVIL